MEKNTKNGKYDRAQNDEDEVEDESERDDEIEDGEENEDEMKLQ